MAAGAAAGLLALALLLFLVPGWLLAVRRPRWEGLPIAFGASFVLLTALNVPLLAFHGTMAGLVAVWVVLTLGLAAWRRPVWARPSWWWLAPLGMAVLLSRAGAFLGGEEEIELIVTRKLLGSDGFRVEALNYLPGLAPTYLLTPLYLFRAFLSQVSGIDPVDLQVRLGFLGPLLGVLAVGALVSHLRGRRDGAAFVAVALVALALMPVGSRVPPLLFASQGLLFFRGVFTVQVLHPLWALATFRQSLWSLGLLAALLFVHGLDALYCLPGLLLIARGRRLAVLLAGSVALILAFKVLHGAYHPEDLTAVARPAVLALLPRLSLLDLPAPVSHWAYLRDRGVAFDLIDSFFMARLGPVLSVAMLCVPWLVLARRRAWLWGMPVLAVLLLRLPFLLVPALAVSPSLFPNLVYFVALPLLIGLWDAAVAAGGWLVGRWRLTGLAAALGLGLLLPRLGRQLADFGMRDRDVALAGFLALCLLAWALRRRVARGPQGWPTYVAAGLLLVPLLTSTSNAPRGSLLAAPPAKAAVAPRGLVEVLEYVRSSVPRGRLFAADPEVIRTIPLLADQYIVHSGVPFDFVEPYFERYGENHPPLPRVAEDFPVEYVVTTTAFDGELLFESEEWRLYRVSRRTGRPG